MRRFLIALSGARPQVLERCPMEYGKFESIGAAVLITGVFAVVSMSFALSSALGVNIVLAVIAGLAWSAAIMTLDRWLVSTIRADASLRRRLVTVIPRLVLAVLLGVVVSTPLVLQIFDDEIDAQIVAIKQQRADAFTARQHQGDVGKDVAALRDEVAALEKVITSGGDVPIDLSRDPKIKSLKADRANEQKLADKHYKEWQCQLYGGPSCPKKGNGPLAKDSKRAYDKNKRRIDRYNRQIDARKRQLAADNEAAKQTRLASAEEALPKTRAQLTVALKRQAGLDAMFDAENLSMNGLLIRIQALNQVTGTDTSLRNTRFLLFLLFMVFECLPVGFKLMQRPGNYEKVLALAEQHEFRDARSSFAPQTAGVSVVDPTHHSAELWDIWSRPGDSGSHRTISDFDRPLRGPNGTRVNGTPETRDEYHSPDDEALRWMPDTRALRVSKPERSSMVELLPDDD